MKAAVLYEVRQPLIVEDVVIAKPGPREVLIRTMAAGVCHSDLHIIDGSIPFLYPTIPGHEAAGIVEMVGEDVTLVRKGDHVVTCVSSYCGHCEECLTGHLSICRKPGTTRKRGEGARLECVGPEPKPTMTQFFGLSSFAEYMLVHERSCCAIRKDMPFDKAALIGCAVTTGVGAIMRTAHVKPGQTVVVIGCGGVGLSAINGAAIAGAGRIIAIDRMESKLAMAKRMGATDTVDASTGDVVETVMTMTGGGAHHCLEAIGLKSTIEQSFAMLRPGGTATIIGVVAAGTEITLPGLDFLYEKKIQGSAMGSNIFPVDMPTLVEFYLAGKLNLDILISQHLPLSGINAALDDLRKGEVARTIIDFAN